MITGQKRPNSSKNDDTDDINDIKPPSKRLRSEWYGPNVLSNEEISKLPILTNPSFHKVVFESFRLAKNIKKPTIEIEKIPIEGNPKAPPLIRCTLTVSNRGENTKPLTRITTTAPSKKKAEILAYQQLNYQHIPYNDLINHMKPYSFSNGLNLQSILEKRGEHLKNKTCTLYLKTLPLDCYELDIINLFNTLNLSKPTHIEFIRPTNKSIYQEVCIQFNNETECNNAVEKLNNKLYRSHRLVCDWYNKTLPNWLSLEGKTSYLIFVGFPYDTKIINVQNFLLKHNIQSNGIILNYRHALIPVACIKFSNFKKTKEIYEYFNKDDNNKYNDKYSLFIRYGNKDEYKNCEDVTTINDQVTRASTCIDISNISWEINEEELEKLFSKCGNIIKLHLYPKKDLFPGSGIIEFEKEENAEKAIREFNGYILNGFSLQIDLHHKQSSEDKKYIRTLYSLKEEEEAQTNKHKKEESKKKRKQKNQRKRLKKKTTRTNKKPQNS